MSAYLKLEGIKGEARAAGYAGWIAVDSVQFGRGGTPTGAGAASSAVRGERDLFVTARMGMHSPLLAQLAINGRSTNGELALLDAGGARHGTVKLVDVIVAGYQTATSGVAGEVEAITLNTQAPYAYVPSTAVLLKGRWLVTIGKWTGYFVFEANGTVYWTERNGTGRHNGLWKATAADVQWKFATPGDVRTFVIPVPIPSGQVGGRILPVGQGFFTMSRA